LPRQKSETLMNRTFNWVKKPTMIGIMAVIAACGGGGGSDDGSSATPTPNGENQTTTPPTTGTPVATTAAKIAGTAAIGAALGGATVTIKDASGTSVCTEQTITTSATGAFSCTLVAGKTAPFIILVVDPSGASNPLVSAATTTPVAGATLVVNATPLTTAIIGQLAPDKNALTVVGTPSLLNAGALATITTNVLAQIADAVNAINIPGYNPFSTPIVAATNSTAGNPADRILDIIKIANVAGVPTISTPDNPDNGVALADTNSTSQKLTAPSTGVIALSESVRIATLALKNCFALPVASRVLGKDTTKPINEGGPTVTTVADACTDIAHPAYLNNGYQSGQEYYGLLTDENMTGATVYPPEIMRYTDDASPADNDTAIINIRYVDRNGVAGNIITTARKFPGSATANRNTDWFLYGNQQKVESSVQAMIRKSEQLAPNPGVAPFAGAGTSRYEAGINIFINKDGPNSAGMRAARVRGPGLPPAGLVYTRPNPSIITSQNWLNIRRKDGLTDPASATTAADNGNIYQLQRTAGLVGAEATTVRPNPNAANSNNTAFITWAHPLDYGAPVGATDYINFSALKPLTIYVLEIFYEGETAPRYTYNKTLIAGVKPATRGGSEQWVDFDAATKAYLNPADPKAAATSSIAISWIANPLAETIRSAGVYTSATSGTTVNSVDQGTIPAPRGATSVVATAPGAAGTVFPTLLNNGSTSRILQLRYRTLDGSYKDSFARYN
jgi:hypothetical protein